MENSSALDPESLGKLALRLFGEQELKVNPVNCILRTIDLVDRVTGTTLPIQGLGSETPAQNSLSRRLGEVAQAKGLDPEALAERLQVSPQAVRSWQHGIMPSPANRAKIGKFLDSQTSPSDAAGAERRVESGELFTEPAADLSKLSGEPPA